MPSLKKDQQESPSKVGGILIFLQMNIENLLFVSKRFTKFGLIKSIIYVQSNFLQHLQDRKLLQSALLQKWQTRQPLFYNKEGCN